MAFDKHPYDHSGWLSHELTLLPTSHSKAKKAVECGDKWWRKSVLPPNLIDAFLLVEWREQTNLVETTPISIR